MWNISRKRAAAVYSPHLNWHSTLAVVPSIFYCDTLHPDSTRFQNPNPEVGCTAIHTLGSNLLWSRYWKFDVLSPALLELSQVVEQGANYLDLGHFNDVTYSWNIHDFFPQSFRDTIFILLKNLMRFLKGFGHVVRSLAGIRTGYKFVRITGFHTKSCKTHSLRFQLLDMRSIEKLQFVFN